MANHISAKKRAIRNAKRSLISKSKLTSLRNSLKKVEQAITAGNAKDADAALKKVQPQIAKGVSAGLITKNAGARKMSRLSARIKALKKSAKA
ncbi:MAG: 30S ribosomal protein S20 [Alphaproteobacteria bacterium]|nr:30S ribosomal protein S20 [Alphaproteobacteria bacterium]